ncbi:hypothetical protein I302_108930 [Kwoniella bestiolae CBS 10118]|uniref:Uncharacterized protein n=1 Tax=Kwoniella bestiolae CBS 10118 TaxID=1296100 RepID=A0A1B9FUH0_9TREE|nr:hypothetical protein I302_08071 [Kwoniella bestiolae CBS 10118]OCF22423.1 hypothetical protein I302_08071 [Kwoniella bestiolae CBS 10118]
MQSTKTSSAEQNVLTKTFPDDDFHKMVYLKSPGCCPPRKGPYIFRASFPHDGRLIPIEALPFFQSKLRSPSSFIIKPQELYTADEDGKGAMTDTTLGTIYQTTRASGDITGSVEYYNTSDIPVRKATVRLEHVDGFTLDTLPEADLKALQATHLFSKFMSIGATVRSIDSIVPQITDNLVDGLTSEEGRLMYLPLVETEIFGRRHKGKYDWISEAFLSEVEIILEADADATVVLPEHDSESTKKALRDHFGGRSFVIPATRFLREYAELELEAS